MSHKPLNSVLRFLATLVSSCMQVTLRFLIPAASSVEFFVTDMGPFLMRTHSIRQRRERATRKINLLVSSIAPTRLLVGGIGATNVILVKVVERTHSTSVRMAFATRRMHMLLQFPIAAVVVCLFGGALCIGLAPPGLAFDQVASGFQMAFPSHSIVAGFGSSVLAGRIAGMLPLVNLGGLGPVGSMARE